MQATRPASFQAAKSRIRYCCSPNIIVWVADSGQVTETFLLGLIVCISLQYSGSPCQGLFKTSFCLFFRCHSTKHLMAETLALSPLGALKMREREQNPHKGQKQIPLRMLTGETRTPHPCRGELQFSSAPHSCTLQVVLSAASRTFQFADWWKQQQGFVVVQAPTLFMCCLL